jgi:hypothetical protein
VKEKYVHMGINHVSDTVRELKSVNERMKRLLGRLPLSDHHEIAHLAQLADKQVRLLQRPVRRVRLSENAMLDREKDSAVVLREWYRRELMRGSIRKKVVS